MTTALAPDAGLSSPGVNAAELLILGRRLMQLAEEALPQHEGARSARIVLIDIAQHPGSSIREITERTGFPQSLVSLSVSALREQGVVATEPDPADRRRTLVSPTGELVRRATSGPGRASIQAVLSRQLGDEAEHELPDVLAALELLAERLG